MTISGNIADKGAGIYNKGSMTLTDVTISNNGNGSTDEGGGIFNENGATLNRVTVSGNQAGKSGGGLYTKKPATILNSAFDSNSAEDGGGIYNDSSGAGLSMVNVTISGNTADKKGGGLFTKDGVSILNNTITLNDAKDGGGIHIESNTISLKNTIVAGNTAASNPDIRGTFTSQGHNLIQNTTGVSGFVSSDITGVSADLDPLADNGGITKTHALQATSSGHQ